MEEKIKQLCDQVRETAYAIHEYHGTGHLEKVYENALVHRLKRSTPQPILSLSLFLSFVFSALSRG